MEKTKIILLFSVFFLTGCQVSHKIVDFKVGTELIDPYNPFKGFVKKKETFFHHRDVIAIWIKLVNSDKPRTLKIYRIYPNGMTVPIAQNKAPAGKKPIVWFREVCVVAAKHELVVLRAELGDSTKQVIFEISPKVSRE